MALGRYSRYCQLKKNPRIFARVFLKVLVHQFAQDYSGLFFLFLTAIKRAFS